ncbi:MAG: DUF115 domain-containing protein [Spirochaetaceae bacterium]|nr:DUF115 domain-containing protein [Spirochaetaceae bacterium]
MHRKFPGLELIALHAYSSAPIPAAAALPVRRWSPETGIPLRVFLECAIPETAASAIKIIEWRPALSVYGEAYRWLLRETVDFIKRLDANMRTTRAFGPRWFRNFFKNLLIIRRVRLQDHSGTLPLILTAAGPSLEEALPLIHGLRRQSPHGILAVSSSVPALNARGIQPDMVITTDGGPWASFHLYECLRRPPPWALAASLCAALPSQCEDIDLVPLSDGSLWQTLILRALGIPFISVPQRGTVSASALDLALSLTQGKIYLAGMDLAHRDIRTHARPYSFDRLLTEGAFRLNPAYTQSFTRSRSILVNGSHAIYAAWFRQHLDTYPDRIYPLGSAHPVFKALKEREDLRLPMPVAQEPLIRTLPIPRQDHPVQKGLSVLMQALEDPCTQAKVREEATSLVTPGEEVGLHTLKARMFRLVQPYTKVRL